jgi:sec-independent protein translocase protein TatB
MFDIGFWELAIIGVVGLIVLGPERLPRAARTAAMWVKKAKRIVTDMKSEIEREIDMEDMKKIVSEDMIETLDEFKKEVKESVNIDKDDLDMGVDMNDPAGLKSLDSTHQASKTSKVTPQSKETASQAKPDNDK